MSLESDLLKQRLDRTRQIEALGQRPYGQRFDYSHTIPEILSEHASRSGEDLDANRVPVKIAGRIATLRRMGKAGFAHLQQNGERLQIYVRKDSIDEKDWKLYDLLDAGDIVGCDGYLFRTRTGELSVHVEKLHFLAKTLLTMPVTRANVVIECEERPWLSLRTRRPPSWKPGVDLPTTYPE